MKIQGRKIGLLITFFIVSTFNFELNSQQFTRVTDHVLVEENVRSFACAWVDFDNDGDLDLFVGNLGSQNSLYRNEGDHFLKLDSEKVGSILIAVGESFSVSWGDFDNDGLIDAFVTQFNGPVTLHRQIKSGVFEGIVINGLDTSFPSQGAGWADVDLDGDLDLFIANSSNTKNILLINGGNYEFKPDNGNWNQVSTSSHGVAWGDFNNDRFPDLFVAENYEGTNLFYVNKKGRLEVFTQDKIFDEKIVSTGASWIDYDNDGDLDLFVTNSLSKKNSLYENDGDGKFSRVENSVLVLDEANSMGACWGDYDNDGDLDLFVANSGTQNDNYYINLGDGTFRKEERESLTQDGKASRGCTCGDYDNDGDLDLYVTSGFGQDDHNMLYNNNGNSNSWVKFDLEGTTSNRSAIGARVEVSASINNKQVKQLKEVSSQTGAYGHNALQVHFGLGNARKIMVTISWQSGKIQTFKNVISNQIYRLKEGEEKMQLRLFKNSGADK